jgi:hypothetical protein
MASARTHCPKCGRQTVSELSDLLFAPNVDFFGCKLCRHIWHVDKGQEEPARYDLLGGTAIGDPSALSPTSPLSIGS